MHKFLRDEALTWFDLETRAKIRKVLEETIADPSYVDLYEPAVESIKQIKFEKFPH